MRKILMLTAMVILLIPGCADETPVTPPDCPDCPEPIHDTVPPVRVTDLSALSVTDSTVVLTWTATGDDFAQGRASFYDIRHTLHEDSLLHWSDECSIVQGNTPAFSGLTEELTITGFVPLERNYFGLKAADEDSNWSPISNVILVENSCTRAVTSPLSGEYYCAGDTVVITWSTPECLSGTVDIALLHDDLACLEIATDLENSGEFRWVAGQYLGSESSYRISISQHDGSNYAESPGNFFITDGCSLSMIFPNGGQYFCRGSLKPVHWGRSSCCSHSILVELLHDFSVIDTLESIDDSGDFWLVDSPLMEESGYQIRVTDLEIGATDVSEYSFNIGGPRLPELRYPVGGEVFAEGEDIIISWGSWECAGEQVKIELEYEDQVCRVIDESTSNDGTFQWQAMSDGGGEGGYSIVITDSASGFSSISPGVFTIERPCFLSYQTPVLLSSFCMGDMMEITWIHGRWCGPMVKIEIINEDRTFVLTEETANDGVFQGLAPDSVEFDGYARVRITDLTSGEVAEGEPIHLQPACELEMVFPAGGEEFINGLPVIITWLAEVCCGPTVNINLLRNGVHCQSIGENIDINAGRFEWVAERCDDEGAGYQLEIIESGYQESFRTVSPFTVEDVCGFQIDQPTAGDIFHSGENIQVHWATGDYCAEEVRVEFLDEDQAVIYGPVVVANIGAYTVDSASLSHGRQLIRVCLTDPVSGVHALGEEFEVRLSPYILRADGLGDFSTIQEAIDASAEGYEILLDDGIYSWTDHGLMVVSENGVNIGSLNGNPENCIFDCESSGMAFWVFGVETGVQFSGITIRNGAGHYPLGYNGGAVNINSSNVAFANCIFEDNIINSSYMGSGGAVYCYNSPVLFSDCIFSGNQVIRSGNIRGDAIYFSYSSTLTLNQCTFVDNGLLQGSIVELDGEVECRIENSIFSFNQGKPIVGFIDLLTLECSDLFSNFDAGWPEYLGQWETGHNNFSSDPIFCDGPSGNWNIESSSPCSPQNSPCGHVVGSGEVGCR